MIEVGKDEKQHLQEGQHPLFLEQVSMWWTLEREALLEVKIRKIDVLNKPASSWQSSLGPHRPLQCTCTRWTRLKNKALQIETGQVDKGQD